MPRALALLPLVLCTTLAHALTIEVAPGGAVNSLAAARDAVRAARAKDDKSEMRVVVAAGTYALTEPVVFEPQDSGVTYEAAPGAQPVFAVQSPPALAFQPVIFFPPAKTGCAPGAAS